MEFTGQLKGPCHAVTRIPGLGVLEAEWRQRDPWLLLFPQSRNETCSQQRTLARPRRSADQEQMSFAIPAHPPQDLETFPNIFAAAEENRGVAIFERLEPTKWRTLKVPGKRVRANAASGERADEQ